MKSHRIFAVLVFFVGICFSALSHSGVKVLDQKFESAPHQVIHDATLQVLEALDGGLDPVNEPEKFVEQLSAILDPVVAFDYIARGVMGNYAKQVSPEQVKQFSSAFKLGLVNTYGKGMANFSDLEIAVLPPEKRLEKEERRTAVVQEIRGASGTNQVTYTMGKNRQGQWKMINVVLNGINLGQTFRGQFAAAVEKNKGDVVKTIDEWGKS